MKERRQTEKARLESLLRISQYHAKSRQDLLDFALNEAITLTQSEIGYIYFYNNQTRQFILNSWSDGVMDVCRITEPQTVYDLDKTGIWGEAVRQGRPIVINNFAAPHPLKKGYPEGHAPLLRFMTVPVFSEGSIVAVVGLANKKSDYIEVDIQQASLLMSSLWQMAERKKFEDALAQSQAMLAQIISTLPARIFWKDADFKYLGCNSLFAFDAGLNSPEDIAGKTDKDLAWSDRAGEYEETDRNVFSTGLPMIGYEEEVSSPTGEKRWLHRHKLPLKDATGRVTGLLGMYEDITGMKKDQLRLSRLAAIVEASEDAIIGTTPEGIITDWNRGAEKIFGYRVSEIQGQPIAILAPPEKQEEVEGILRAIRAGMHIDHYETIRVRKNKDPFYISLSVSAIMDKNNVLAGLSIIGRDVTERKKNESELERYRDFIENISDGCFEVDLKGNILFVNEAVETRLGYVRGSLIGVNNRAYTKPEEAKRILDVFRNVYRTGKPDTIDDYAIMDADGNTRYIAMSVSLIRDAEGNPAGYRGTTRDNTERKIAQIALEQSEARYRNLFQYNKAAMLLIDPDTTAIVDANLAACSYYQYTRDELLRKSIMDLNVQSDEDVREETQRADREQRSQLYFRHRLANGDIHPVEVFSGPIEIGGKQLLYAIIHDITARREAEQAVRESEEKYRTILETISEGYLEHDLEGNFLFANDAACTLAGYTREDIVGMNYRRVVSEETAGKMFSIYNSIYKTGQSETLLDFEIIRRDGSRVMLELNAMLMRNQDGKPTGFRVMSRDVTARRRAEDELRRSEERYRSILENISEGYFESDLQGNVVFSNDAGCLMMGYDRPSLYQINYRQFTTPDTRIRIRDTYNSVFKTGIHSKMDDYEIIRGDGALRVHQLTVGLIRDAEGNPTGFRTVARDVTEQKQAEEALRQSEERIRLLFNNIPVPTFVWKARAQELILAEFNAAAFQFIGDRVIDFVGKTADQFFERMPQVPADIRRCQALGKTVENQFWYSLDDRAEKRYVIVKYAYAPPDSVLMHVNDITGQKRAEENLQYISIHDSLTGLFNRFYADAEISRLSSSRLRPVSVIIIDLNDLKKINDEFGHAMGDLYIKNAAALLKQTFRPEDMTARIGGDEFLALLPLVDEDICAQAIERLNENIKSFNANNDQPMSLSAGCATAHTGDNLADRIREADRRMYDEKAAMKAASSTPAPH
ncbi:MAG: PAS domain S-box protein [Smithellaceae bacterium]